MHEYSRNTQKLREYLRVCSNLCAGGTVIAQHGFVCPWNIYQIITLIFFVSTILTTYFVIFPALLYYEATHTKLQYIIVSVAALLFLVISFTILSLAITTTTINPLDPLVLKQRYLRYNKIPIDAHKLQEGKPLELYC